MTQIPQPVRTNNYAKSEEERLRNKRERNRRAAANCRKRKEERIKSLEAENKELRRTIAELEARLSKESQSADNSPIVH